MDQNLIRKEERLEEPEVRLECRLLFEGISFTIEKDGRLLGYVTIAFFRNRRHKEPYAELKDLYVEEDVQRQGLGTKLVQRVIEEAKKHSCYKLTADSRDERPWVHALYRKLGFKDHGRSFRMDFGVENEP